MHSLLVKPLKRMFSEPRALLTLIFLPFSTFKTQFRTQLFREILLGAHQVKFIHFSFNKSLWSFYYVQKPVVSWEEGYNIQALQSPPMKAPTLGPLLFLPLGHSISKSITGLAHCCRLAYTLVSSTALSSLFCQLHQEFLTRGRCSINV